MINFEGGAVPEEYRVQYVFDRTDTTATVWMFVHAHADYETSSLPVELAIDGDGGTGWGAGYASMPTARTAVFWVGQAPDPEAREAAAHPGGARLRIVLRQESGYAEKTIRRFRLSVSSAPEVGFQSLEPSSLSGPYGGLAAAYREFEYLVALPGDQRTEWQATEFRHRFRRGFWPPWRPNEERYAALSKRRRKIEAEVPTTMVMREMEEPRPTFVLRRGEYDQQADEVDAAVPSFLPPIPEELPKNRLGLARWLVSEEHPLTARVTANRMWQRFFGRGLVGTSGDFGAQGEWPSHPDLLDWLATELVRLDWDLKALQMTIVMSSRAGAALPPVSSSRTRARRSTGAASTPSGSGRCRHPRRRSTTIPASPFFRPATSSRGAPASEPG